MSENYEKGIIKNPSKKFWIGLISFIGLLLSLFFSIKMKAPEGVLKWIVITIGWVSTTWMLGIAAVDSIVRGMREWRMGKIGLPPIEYEVEKRNTLDLPRMSE